MFRKDNTVAREEGISPLDNSDLTQYSSLFCDRCRSQLLQVNYAPSFPLIDVTITSNVFDWLTCHIALYFALRIVVIVTGRGPEISTMMIPCK